jgi:hypothetical protein
MDNYIATLNNVGESIVAWADPNNQYTGYTNVRLSLIAIRLNFALTRRLSLTFLDPAPIETKFC